MKRPELQILTKKQLQQARESEEFLLGVQCGANAARQLIKSGWTDMETFEREILRRVRGNQPFKLGEGERSQSANLGKLSQPKQDQRG
jgi:hypothetical protein